MFLTSDNGLISAIFLRNLCVQKPKPVRPLRNLCVTIDQCAVGVFLSSYIDGYANDPLEIKLVVCGDNFEIKDMRTPFSVIHDFGLVLCVYECVFLLILGMYKEHKDNYIGISSRNKLN